MIIATDRARRPTDFTRQRVAPQSQRICPFCPGNETRTPPEVLAYRQSGQSDSSGWSLRVVPNKFPALRIEGGLERTGEGLYDRMNGIGAHEVIIESARHDATFGTMAENEAADVFFAFRDRIVDLKKDDRFRYILIFKNHGELAGATLEHPHSQLIALPIVPKRVQEELDGARRHFEYRDRCIFCDIIAQETRESERVVLATDHFVALAPYASRFPFEMWVLPRKHNSHFETTDPQAMHNLGWVLRTLMDRMERALEHPPYNIILHTSPAQDPPLDHYHWHIEIMPKLTKVAGFEWGTGFYINPTPPEEAAGFLRQMPAR